MALKAVISYKKLDVVVDVSASSALVGYAELQIIPQFVNLNTITSYLNVTAADILIDSYSINQWWLADSDLFDLDSSNYRARFVLSESASLNAGKVLAEAFELTTVTNLDVGKGFSETPTLSDTEILSVGKALTDSTSIAESHALSVGRPVSDSFSFADDDTISFGKKPSDSFTFADDDTLSFGKSVSDTHTMSESLSRVVQYVRTISDAYALDDSASAQDDLSTDTGLNKNNVVSMSE